VGLVRGFLPGVDRHLYLAGSRPESQQVGEGHAPRCEVQKPTLNPQVLKANEPHGPGGADFPAPNPISAVNSTSHVVGVLGETELV
jgi:hypothetical protein